MNGLRAGALCSCGLVHKDGLPCPSAGHFSSMEEAGAGPAEARREGQPDEDRFADAARVEYRIAGMDCPAEEALIRKKLAGVSGVRAVEFNPARRMLTVRHDLPSTDTIEAALNSIGMTPEATAEPARALSVFSIQGMDCPLEEKLIRGRLSALPGVAGLDFNLMRRRLEVRHDVSALAAILEALAALDLGAVLLDEKVLEPEAGREKKIPWGRLVAAGLLALAAELIELLPGLRLSVGSYELREWLTPALALAAVLLGGLGTYKKGWIALRHFNLNINALMSVAVTGALLIGQYPEAAMVMVLFNLAEAIESKSLDKARKAIGDLLSLAPAKATFQLPDGAWSERDIREIPLGGRLRVKPGERIAMDGVIVAGASSVNQAPITGESLPVEKTVGDQVFAGSINESGSFEFTVTAAASDSTLARIIHAVEEAQGSRAPMQRFVDSFARIYTPAIFLLAFLTALVPPLFMGAVWSESIYMALVLLVIGCPCALVISTPVSIVSALAAATRHGILIKGGIFLELGRQLKWLALDKTGTITYGRPRQTDFVLVGHMDERRATALAASLAARSDHPVSRAVAGRAAESGAELFEVTDFTAVPGQGVSGGIDGRQWRLGNHRMVEECGRCSIDLERRIEALERQGKSVVALIGEEGVQALFAVADTLKESSIAAINELKRLGVKTMMLTGDNGHTAERIAESVGVDAFQGDLLPAGKLAAVEKLAEKGQVGMVGDGINDAPALARADIGFAMAAAGTDTAVETADVALMDDDLRKIPRFIRLSKSTYAVLVQNIVMAVGVKAVFFALTFSGLATMWMAVFADMGVSLLVVANGLRMLRK